MLQVKQLSIESGDFSLSELSFSIPKASCTTLMGPSGSGKSTLMEALCGLRKITTGRVSLMGNDITALRPAERRIALVPQDNALFPHLSVRENLAFGPRVLSWDKAMINERCQQLAEKLAIDHLLTRQVTSLSGGEAKRVAIGRALASSPRLLCLDEALTGLDESTHTETLELIRDTIITEQVTTLHITHSLTEANSLADTILTIQDGKLLNIRS